MEREKDLILKGSPCNVNYFDNDLLTVQQAVEGGQPSCSNLEQCQKDEYLCALQLGHQVAGHVATKGNLEKQMGDFTGVKFINEKFWNTIDGKKFSLKQGKAKMLRAVEAYARIILSMNPFESIYDFCGKCDGIKITETVYDSIHDGPFRCSGSGRTVSREVEYCPECDPKPQGGILKEDPADAREREFLKKLSGKK